MMGVGKSTVGRFMSKKLKMPFKDLDRQIEKLESLTIKEIFDLKGEPYFRNLEEVEILKIIKKKGRVIALGGGTFINQKVRKNIKKTCFSVWLDLPPEKIFSRVKKNKRRPLLSQAKSIKDVEKIYLNRKKIYAMSDYKLNCANKSIKQIASEIEKIYENL